MAASVLFPVRASLWESRAKTTYSCRRAKFAQFAENLITAPTERSITEDDCGACYIVGSLRRPADFARTCIPIRLPANTDKLILQTEDYIQW